MVGGDAIQPKALNGCGLVYGVARYKEKRVPEVCGAIFSFVPLSPAGRHGSSRLIHKMYPTMVVSRCTAPGSGFGDD